MPLDLDSLAKNFAKTLQKFRCKLVGIMKNVPGDFLHFTLYVLYMYFICLY